MKKSPTHFALSKKYETGNWELSEGLDGPNHSVSYWRLSATGPGSATLTLVSVRV